MITTLEEAIAHAKEVAIYQRKVADTWKDLSDRVKMNVPSDYWICLECAKEHELLAEWLTELAERRESDRWVPVSERLPNDRDWYLGVFREPDTYFVGIPYICDYVGEVTKGTTNEGWILRQCTDVDNASDYFRNLICTAWKPLPKPYESEDK